MFCHELRELARIAFVKEVAEYSATIIRIE